VTEIPAGRLVVAICTSRPDDLRARWKHTVAQLRDEELYVVVDDVESREWGALIGEIRAAGGTVHVLGAPRGLSAARNAVLDERGDHSILFIDDDVLISGAAIASAGAAFAAGAHIVGARLVPPGDPADLPWFLTPGQVHLVGWHSSAEAVKVWGACMGIDARFARAHGLRFDQQLGRTGRRLESGDDTSFVAAMKQRGARETLLRSVTVIHDVSPSRYRLRYLLRRVYWQGRSEVRRGQGLAGLRKEWGRHWKLSPPDRRAVLTGLYLAAFLAGAAVETAAIRKSRRARHAERRSPCRRTGSR
jgi:hypothetical protein